ncbi:hypothetical protein CFE70_001366 [Pyrenophora teres f. teres 0-1]
MDSPRVSEHDDRGTEKMWAWNYEIPGVTNKCIHDLFAEQVLAQPNAPAICAWDGKMSYSVLDNLSTTLAGYLVKIGVKPEDVVPLCFEKSMWTVVAMLAVLKAGGAFAPLDPDHPASRHKEILRQTSARVVLVSAQHSARWASSSCHVVTLSEASISQLTADDLPNFSATPGNAAYILFTSGSTGIPKGVVLEHRAVSTSCLGHGRAFGITDQSRVLQFTSYTFDFCMAEIITTLLYGGCICVPSDRDRRSDLAKAINAMGANWALLTPSVAQLLNPSDVPTLKILVIGGEQVTSTDWNRWPTSVQLINGYGPTECCIVCAGYTTTQAFTTGTIGRAIASVSWVVDPENHHKLAPLGSVGELLVEGPILARGYLNDAEKTAAAFIEDPAWLMDGCQGYAGRRGRLYKTGDLVQYNDDGNLVCLGRKDSQVKLRGQRIELGEIEHHLRECLPEATQMAVEVILPSEESKHATLAAFVRLEQDYCHIPAVGILAGGNWKAQAVTISDIVDALAERLPTHMIPTIFITLEVFPMTTSGKTDRKVLREIGASFTPQQLANVRTSRQGQKRQPTTPAERAMQQLWAGVLAIAPDSIGLDDSFFRLGGDSIAAMKLVGEARRAGIQLTVADLFRNPRLDQLTAAATASTHASPVSIPQVEHVGPVAQSFAQGRLWFLEELHPGLTWYLMPLAVRIRGPLDLPALHSALLAVERRHETLRTTFATVDGASVQVVQPFQAKDLNIIDIVPGDEQGLAEAVQQEQGTVFNLRTQPGWRVTVYRVGEHDHVLSIVMHHIISDGWSVDVLMRELAGFYSASVRGHDPLSQVQPLPVQYRDFSLWQRQQAQADEHQKQLSYWVEQLQTSRPAELLCDKPRPAALSGQAGVQSIKIAGPLYAKLQSFCQLHGVTQFVVLLAAFRTAHFRLTGQDDATIGTVNANRDRWEIKDMIGFFVNMQCLRITAGHGSFEELVQQVHEVMIASHANADVPFESIVSKLKSDRDLSRHPLVQLVFAVHAQQDLGQLNLEGVQTESLADAKTSRFDLEFHFYQQSDGLLGNILFSTDLYAPETIDNLLSVFQRVLEACLDDPQAPVASMPLLREDNYAKLDAMGLVRAEETAYPRDSSVVDLFREQAAACPSRVAVKDSVTEMTYAQLDTASDVLARWLARRSLAPETLVGVFASRSCEAIVAFLGILKANLAYLPFDVKIPRKRMEDILSSLPGHRIILVGVGAQPPSTELSNIELVGIREALDEQAKTKDGKHTLAVCSGPSATSLAYVMFTSGSTGMPKGVMAEHRGIVRLVRDNNLVQHLPDSPVMAHMANLAFDASTWEIYSTLLRGGTLVCIGAAMVLDAEAVLQMFREHCIRTAYMAPSLFRSYILQAPALFTGLDMLCVGGEAVHPADLVAAKQYLTGKFVNGYGPTENTTFSATFLISPEGQYANGIPIGRALSNSGAFVMDAKLQLVPLGVVGELVVTGDGLARGYTDPARNIDRFVSVEIGGKTVRAYRTGDYVRHRPTDGQLEFFGRMDGQVKIRGNRVELGEVEHALRSDKAVREAVAVLQQHDGSEARLAGFVTVHEDAETADEHVDDSNESQHVDVWEDKFDADIYSPIDNVQKENIGRDFVGWTSMYDGSDIDKAEMNEWLDDTIDTMLNGQRPGNVLEIGSGTGMILFNLGDGLQSYVGLDPSRKAVQFIAETAKSIPGLAGKIRMYKATAADVGRLEQPVAASLVVINSVVQYFPSLDYLFKTVQQLVELEGTRTLFFGDVRSYALHREFLATRAVHMAGDRATKADIRRMVADMERVERELLVDPAFFTALPSRLPGLVDHVEILPKKMKATNELSCYRYAAVVHLTPRDGQARELAVREAGSPVSPAAAAWPLYLATIAVSNIPYSKTMVSRCLVRSLDGAEGETSDSPDWLASVHQQTQDCRSLSAAELVELAQEADCRVEISWSRQHSQQGGLDAIFHRYQPLTGERVMFRFPTDHAERPLHSLSSKPLRQQFLQKTQQRLVEMLEAQLPTYMVPQTLTVLDAMPVNPNGKVDRKALEQQADTQSNHSGQKQQPSTPAERAMQQLFFRLGGDSIAAMKLVGEARRAGIQLTVADLFRNPRLDQLTAAATASTHASPVSIPQVEHVGPVAQSFAQGRLWFLEELHPGLTWYLMPLAVRIRGPLDLPALHSALLAVERRHETLRTTFATVDGASVQVVQPFQAKDLNIIDIVPGDEQGLAEAVQQEQGTVFNLRTQPGWRVTVYRVGEHDHVLSIVMHHIISDGWSVDVLMQTAQLLGRAAADKPACRAALRQAPTGSTVWTGRRTFYRDSGPLYAKLQSFCQLHGVTQFVVLLAAFRTAHFRLTGQDDATIGTVNANRDRWEIKDMIGFFVSMQCLRITIGDNSFEQLVQQLVKERDLSRNPLVQLVFAVHALGELGQLKLDDAETEIISEETTTRFDLEFHFYQQSDGLLGNILFSTDLYAPETIDNLLSVFQRVLEACLDDPQAPVASMPLLREDNYAKLDAMGLVRAEETAYPRDSSVVDLFREQAACPSRVAVKDSVTEMTYAQLDTASDVLARWLARRSLAPETLVGVFASRSCEAIVAFLGILKANLAYLPFDGIILVGVGAQPPSTELSNIELVGIREALDEQAKTKDGKHTLAVCSGPSATSLAYVMFTSGSTGMPKGVMAEHRGIVRLVRDNNLVQHLPDSPVMAHMANLAFDASTWEIYSPSCAAARSSALVQPWCWMPRLCCKCSVSIAPNSIHGSVALSELYLASPSTLHWLDMLCVGGEAVHPADLVAAKQYLTGKFRAVRKRHPIGRALSNSGAFVMDAKLQLVPLGVVGELVVTGDGLARGYTDPARNIDRFVSVEIGGKTVRAYRTGDYVRHRPTDGQLEFFGAWMASQDPRKRVELGEVEHALRSDKAVREAVAVLQQHDGSEARLAGSQSGLKRQPETEMQRTMQQLWAGVLAIAPDSIGLDDSFFRLGGDSIAAMKLVGEARRAGIQLTVADLFRNPRLDQLTAAATASTHASPVSIPQVEHVGPVAQSFAQGGCVRIRGPLDLPALHSALLAVERRHETLRTTFATVDGASVQVVQPFQAKDLNIIDIVPGDEQGLAEAVQQEQGTVFNLRTQPGWRVTVYRVGEHDHVLSIVMHHIISDGWSVDVLMRELAGFYSASVRGHDPLSQVQPLPVQYRDFSLWQRQQAQADEHQKQLSYWVEQLQTSRPAELLCDKPRPAALSGQAGVQSIEIAGPLYAKLQSFCQLHGVTQFVVLLAAFRTAHFRLTGQDDATIGTVNANRDRWEIKDMIGFFVSMQCLRITIGDDSLSSWSSNQTPVGNILFSTDLYAPETIDNLLSVFQRVLEACLDDPQAPVASMPLLREDNYAKLDAMGLVRAEETAYPRDSSVVDLFREQAAACPSRVAVKDSVTEMTYAQLDTASDVLARWLARRSLAPETLVGVFASRSCEAIVAFLGILKANLAYLPFDVKIPRKRMEDILSSLPGHRIILVGVGAQPPSTELSNIELVGIREALDEQTKTKAGKHTLAVCSGPSATSLAYVMFTSGSTGMPKGVMAEHRGIVRLVRDNNLVQHLPDSPVMAHMANLAFDASTWEIYSTLLRGGTLVCIGAAMVLDAEAVLQMFREHCIRTAYMAPSLFRSYILQAPALFTGLDMLCVGGEAVHPADLVAAKQYLTGKFVNGYGPTENTTFSATFLISPEGQYANGIPIGRALSNSGAFVMDAKLQLVPLGVVGELVVTGDGLARGYTDPARNIDRFVSVEIGGKTVRAYRTGDYVRHRPTDGQLEFFGRMDGQVKIRGNRVELGEVEHALRSDKAVREAVAVLQQHDGSEARLAGFVTVHEDAEIADEQDTITILDAMPVNQNGKADRKALEQQIGTQEGQSGLKRQPETEMQRTMQQLWAGVLAIAPDSIGLDDSFFRLGGDSIAAMKLVGEARRAGIQLTVADLFRNSRLDQLTAAATASTHASPVSIPQVEHVGPVAQSFAQGRLWFLEELHPGLTWYLMPLAVRIRGPLDLPALHSALLAVERRHETLRTTFATVDGASVQVVQPFQAKDLNIIDIVPGDEQGLTEAVHQDHSTPFDLRTQPGWRVTVYRVGEHDHVLSIVMHHIISDGWSVDVLMRELAGFYSASVRGHDPLSQVQPLPVQYRDFSLWQRQQARLMSTRNSSATGSSSCRQAGLQSCSATSPDRQHCLDRPAHDPRHSSSLYAKLQSFCQLHGVTQFVVLLAAFRTAHFRLTGQDDATIGTVNANRDRWEIKDMIGFFTIDNLLSVFQRVLEACLDDPQAPVASMPLLREDNYAKLDAMGLVRAKRSVSRDSSVVDLFREQAAACPSRVAVKDSVTEMTYAQLDTASDVLARWLARRSLAPETLVGVFASRSCEAIVAFLGILKANLAYLPNIELVGIREAWTSSQDQGGKHTLAVCSGPSATSLAYVMFTSGSTGMPKGVMAEHRGIVRLVRDNNLVQHLPDSPVMAHMANLAFDASTWEIYSTLLRGGTLVCIGAAMVLDAEAVLQMFREHCIRTAYMAPSLFRSYILQAPALFTGLDMLCVGGEAVHPADLVAAKQYLTGKGQYAKRHSIGRALSNSGAFVMDAKLQLVPLGVVGELVVTGDGLARGYTDPARNIDRFVSVEIGGKTVRAYRTGDYVRHRPTDGQLEFFGRMDGQVKIRGNRVELGEVEHASAATRQYEKR